MALNAYEAPLHDESLSTCCTLIIGFLTAPDVSGLPAALRRARRLFDERAQLGLSSSEAADIEAAVLNGQPPEDARDPARRLVASARRRAAASAPNQSTSKALEPRRSKPFDPTTYEPDRWDRAIMRAVEGGAHQVVDIVAAVPTSTQLSRKRTAQRIRERLQPAGYMDFSGSGKGFKVWNEPKGKRLISRRKPAEEEQQTSE